MNLRTRTIDCIRKLRKWSSPKLVAKLDLISSLSPPLCSSIFMSSVCFAVLAASTQRPKLLKRNLEQRTKENMTDIGSRWPPTLWRDALGSCDQALLYAYGGVLVPTASVLKRAQFEKPRSSQQLRNRSDCVVPAHRMSNRKTRTQSDPKRRVEIKWRTQQI